ncbi:MAG: hypothetical protein V1926_05945 [Candidatus Peregrinibacteria bacterium]
MAIISVHCRLLEELLEHPLQKIAECGPCEERDFSGEIRALFLPPRSLPPECCDPHTWKTQMEGGKFRMANQVTSSVPAYSGEFWVKSPECRLTLSKRDLGDVWWDGPRGPDRNNFFFVQGDILRALARWEAAYLTKLWHAGIPAEEPQALIDYPDGRTEIVIKDIVAPTWWRSLTTEQSRSMQGSYEEFQQQVKASGLIPLDWQWLEDMKELRLRIIDVARWSWPPHTDALFTEVRAQLHRALHSAATLH